MKRILTFIAALGIFFAGFAQNPLVTLSHNGELSFFSNLNAFAEALDSAANGDIIYLSEGKFASNSGETTIDKRVSIVGCGYKSHILADLTINLYENPDSFFDMPLFDGVRLQKLEFGTLAQSRENLKNVEIRKCWIKHLGNGGYAGNDFLVDRCLIEDADFSGAYYNNTFVKNSKIGNISNSNEYAIQVINCNIKTTYYCPRVVISSIIEGTSTSTGLLDFSNKHTIYNSLLGSEDLVATSNFETYNCYFDSADGTLLDENLDCTLNLTEKGYLGEDGTVVGAYGGEFPFSVTPSVPTVDSANSSVEYDSENNKLKVTITVAPN